MGKETKILESKNNIEKSIRKNRILQTIVMVSNPSRIGTVLVSLSSMVNRNGVVRVSLNINLSNPTVIMVHKVNTNQDNNLSSLVLNKVNTNQDNNLDFPSNLPLSKVNTLRDSNRDSNMANNMDSLSNHTIKINNTNMDRANRSINMNTIIVIIMKNNTSLSFQSINKKVNMVEINKKVVWSQINLAEVYKLVDINSKACIQISKLEINKTLQGLEEINKILVIKVSMVESNKRLGMIGTT